MTTVSGVAKLLHYFAGADERL